MFAAAALLLTTSNAQAAGIWLSENGTAAMGTATAGRVALANDEIETKFFTSSSS